MIKTFLSNSKTKLVFTSVIALLVFNVALSIYRNTSPSQPLIASHSPTNNATNIDLDQNITFVFKAPVMVDDITITSTPSLVWRLSQINSNTISATHKPDFQPITKYTINLAWKSLGYSPIILTTIRSETDSLLIQNMKDELARDYPLAQKLPYSTPDYRVVYSSPMTLEITLKNSNLTSVEVIDEIKSWVTKNGGDVANHKYVIAPAPAN